MNADKKNPLIGKFLVAMPQITDSIFTKTIILICGQDEKGVVGFIINQPLGGLFLKDLFSQLKISSHSLEASNRIYFGGPVDTSRGFLLHTEDYQSADTLSIPVEGQTICLTNRLDILTHISERKGPQRFLVMLGYVGWDKNQLEEELHQNIWLLAEGNKDLIFDNNKACQWENLYKNLKINPDYLFSTPGHA